MNDDMPIEVIAAECEAREEAERNGLYDMPCLSEEQDYAVWQAMSTLSDIAKETNSSLSNLLKAAGFWQMSELCK